MTPEAKLDPRVKRTRSLLYTALIKLLGERPFNDITVQDITEEAEVNRATFYAHFEDKYMLLDYGVREAFQQRLNSKLPTEATFTRENLSILILATCDYLGEFLDRCVPAPTNNDPAVMVREVQKSVYDVLMEWMAKMPARDEKSISPEILATMISWAIFGSVFQWVQAGRQFSPQRLTDQMLSTLLSGLQAYLAQPANDLSSD